MRRLRQYLELSSAERREFILAILLVAFVRLCLALVSFGTVQRRWSDLVLRATRSNEHRSLLPAKIVWLVAVASRCVPTAHCLARCMAAQVLLARQGYSTTLQIGVRKLGSRLDAHAWLEYDGSPLFESESHLNSFTTMAANGGLGASHGSQ